MQKTVGISSAITIKRQYRITFLTAQNTCNSLTWWASTKFPLKTQETKSDSGGESIIGMRGFCRCGLILLSKSLEPDTLLVLPSARQQNYQHTITEKIFHQITANYQVTVLHIFNTKT